MKRKIFIILFSLTMILNHLLAQDYPYIEFAFFNGSPYYYFKYAPKNDKKIFFFNFEPTINNFIVFGRLITNKFTTGVERNYKIFDNFKIVLGADCGFIYSYEYFDTYSYKLNEQEAYVKKLNLLYGIHGGFRFLFNERFSGYLMFYSQIQQSFVLKVNRAEASSGIDEVFYPRIGIAWLFPIKKRIKK